MSRRSASICLNPRKRPAQSRSVATVDVILEASARILEADGFAGYTTNAVAEKAGVSIGSLYQYFPGKEALTAALIDRETAVLLDGAAKAGEAADGIVGLEQLIEAAVAHQMRRPALARLLDFEEQRLPLNQQIGRVTDILVATIGRLLERVPWVERPDLDITARDILAIVKGMIDAAGRHGEADAAHLKSRVLRAVFGYLCPGTTDTRRRAEDVSLRQI